MRKNDIINALKIALGFFAVIWVVYLVDLVLPVNFNEFGIIPRELSGLLGVLFAPFIHGNFVHILSNSLPFLVLTFTLFAFYPRVGWIVVVFGVVVGGLMVWLMGRGGNHVGASGLIYTMAAFLVAAGFYARSFKAIVISIIVIFLYGGLVWGVLPTRAWVSWEGHLFGAVAGVLLAFLLKNRLKPKKAE
ncbi:MAG: rhomboid family intramembrane serine protease [Salinivirgaceae bacterium]